MPRLTTFPRRSIRPALAACAVLGVAAPLAFALPKDGSYKGTSSGKIEVRVPDPVLGVAIKTQTDKGKVSFKVKGGLIKSLSITGQQAMCGGQNVDVDIKLAVLRMGLGGGAAIYTHPQFGPQSVSVVLGSKGSATGTIRYGGLCARKKATFTAKIG